MRSIELCMEWPHPCRAQSLAQIRGHTHRYSCINLQRIAIANPHRSNLSIEADEVLYVVVEAWPRGALLLVYPLPVYLCKESSFDSTQSFFFWEWRSLLWLFVQVSIHAFDQAHIHASFLCAEDGCQTGFMGQFLLTSKDNTITSVICKFLVPYMAPSLSFDPPTTLPFTPVC
jgi:hypothetical protein